MSSSSLRDKVAQFADLDRPDDDDGHRKGNGIFEAGQTEKPSGGWKDEEREYRRRSREFAAAFSKKRKASEKNEASPKGEETVEPVKTIENDENGSNADTVGNVKHNVGSNKVNVDDDELQILPGPPPPPLHAPGDRHSCMPRRTVSGVLSPAVTAAVATIRRTASNPLPLSASSQRGGDDTHTSKKAKTDKGALGPRSRSPAPSKPSREPTSTPSSARAKKQRASDPPAMVPESQRIFRGLAFYYIPDTNLGPRKLRIAKAREYGAEWVHQLDAATHVIVDKQLSWQDIQSVLRGSSTTGAEAASSTASSAPPSTPTSPFIVKDDYPLDCIGFRCLLNPDQRRYRLAGHPTVDAASSPASSASTKPSSSPVQSRRASSNRARKSSIKTDFKHRQRHGTPPPPKPRAANVPVKEP